VSSKRLLTVVAWSTGAISLAGFAAAWVLAVRNGDAFDITAEFSPDRFMVAYAIAGTILASRRPTNPVGRTEPDRLRGPEPSGVRPGR
jgi:hypothetical protein